MNDTNTQTRRDDFFYAVIAKLNHDQADNGGLYNAGELGHVLIEWNNRRWVARWFIEKFFEQETN